MSDLDKLNREEKVALFALNKLEHMKADGMIRGGLGKFTPKGVALAQELIASGFDPTDAEFLEAVRDLVAEAREDGRPYEATEPYADLPF